MLKLGALNILVYGNTVHIHYIVSSLESTALNDFMKRSLLYYFLLAQYLDCK